jgi:hypothetical protein
MALIYMTIPRRDAVPQITGELLDEGLPRDSIHVFSARPAALRQVPVAVSRYRTPGQAATVGGLAGALIGALVGLPLLDLGALAAAPLLVLAVMGAAAGAVFRLWIGRGPGGEIERLGAPLERGATAVVVDVDAARMNELEQRLKSRHPEVSLLGTDPRGSPPFP